ncbi:MAG: hypothetical protein J6S21_05000, partial [Victivallales bacterium]|nr:hypothetical protein [Victivallales bacterium]
FPRGYAYSFSRPLPPFFTSVHTFAWLLRTALFPSIFAKLHHPLSPLAAVPRSSYSIPSIAFIPAAFFRFHCSFWGNFQWRFVTLCASESAFNSMRSVRPQQQDFPGVILRRKSHHFNDFCVCL